MTYTIAEIADATGLTAVGDISLRISRPAEPESAAAGDLALALSPHYEAALRISCARAAVLWEGADWQALGLASALFAPRARVALAALGDVFAPELDIMPGVHPSAFVDPTARIGEDVWIGPFTAIGARAQIGAGARIMSHVTIGREAVIGSSVWVTQSVPPGTTVTMEKPSLRMRDADGDKLRHKG